MKGALSLSGKAFFDNSRVLQDVEMKNGKIYYSAPEKE